MNALMQLQKCLLLNQYFKFSSRECFPLCSVSEQPGIGSFPAAPVYKLNCSSLSPCFRIAANEPSFMSMQLKILDPRHKQKLNLKALDAVLFGPPLRKCALALHFCSQKKIK